MFPFFFPSTFAWLTFFFFSLSFSGAAPGTMANHLMSNALLRPHGTNNPYNTLLGEPAVCNNPSISMYNAQGALEFILIFFFKWESHFLWLFWARSICFPPAFSLFWKQTHRVLLHSPPPVAFISHLPEVSLVSRPLLISNPSLRVCFPVLLRNVSCCVRISLLLIYFCSKYLCTYCETWMYLSKVSK